MIGFDFFEVYQQAEKELSVSPNGHICLANSWNESWAVLSWDFQTDDGLWSCQDPWWLDVFPGSSHTFSGQVTCVSHPEVDQAFHSWHTLLHHGVTVDATDVMWRTLFPIQCEIFNNNTRMKSSVKIQTTYGDRARATQLNQNLKTSFPLKV